MRKTTRHGARISVGFLRPDFRKQNFRKCAVCGKVLYPSNKIGLCSNDYQREIHLNLRKQGFYNLWKREWRKRNPDKIRQYNQRRRERYRKHKKVGVAIPPISKDKGILATIL